jgi:glyoxylase-like metal-dependent hydrolase (beta-lactamase superfamily II)
MKGDLRMPLERDRPAAADATFAVLFTGYVSRDDHRVGSTVSLAREGGTVVVIDPGLVPSPAAILDPLAALGIAPGGVTDVVLSHHHPDHTLNAALFPDATVHDHWAAYRGDLWTSRPADGVELSPSIRLLHTPGHSAEDVTTLIGTAGGIVACSHLWWTSAGPADDPYAPDRAVLRASRERVLAVASVIVPGHGEPFEPDGQTPR